MTEVLFARAQMGLSLAFHIVFAAVGIAMPLLMVLAEVRHRRTKDPEYLELARRWARGTAVFFAVGAVSGTVLSFELGLLFPGFMRAAGAIVGLPFSLEGFAFFTEAIFLGLYLYGRDRLAPRLHLTAGVIVAASGLASAVFVTFVNAWMNLPRGFATFEGGSFTGVDPVAGMLTPYAPHEIVHTALSAYAAAGLAVAGVHALALLRRPASTLHRKALGLALAVAIPSSLAQPVVGHWAGQRVARLQPMKLAAMEGHVETRARAPLHVGPIVIPAGLSVLAFNDPDAVVRGLAEIPRADWPHPAVRPSFQAMVILGSLAALWAALALVRVARRRPLADSRRWLLATILVAPSGVLAMEAGWMVTELGRQPWIVYGVLRTADTIVPMSGLVVPLVVFTVVYLGLGVVVAATLARQVRETTAPGPGAGGAP